MPNIAGILELIGGKPISEIKPVLRELGNLALLVTARNSNRATPAPSLFAHVLADQRIIHGNEVSHSANNFGPYFAKHVDFSGKGAFMLYKLACMTKVRLSSVFTEDMARQVIFHSWWGTALEDFSLLQQITDCNRWLKRSEYGTAFQRIGSKELGATFELVNYVRYAKLASANLSGLLVNNTEQVAYSTKFSGKQEITHPVSFFKLLEEEQMQHSIVTTVIGAANDLRHTVRKISEKIKSQNSMQQVGTVPWAMIGDLTWTEAGTVQAEEVVKRSGLGGFLSN